MSNKTLLLVGSGPGIGVAVASLFAQRYFDKVCSLRPKPRPAGERPRDHTRFRSERQLHCHRADLAG